MSGSAASARFALVVVALSGFDARAGDAPPEFGRYLPKYPAIYYSVGYSHDERDSSFDGAGAEQSSAVPTVSGDSAYPESSVDAAFVSYFPWFEDAGIPFLSQTLYSARVSLHYGQTVAHGAMADFIATNPEFAPHSRRGDSGLGDIGFEFGAFLLGGRDWRTRKDNPFALVWLAGFDAPVGDYEQTAPVTQGSNRYAWSTGLGTHWRPWNGGFVEAGLGGHWYGRNQNANFGRLAPTQQGADRNWNLSLSQRVLRGAYLGAFITDRRGGRNEYDRVRYAPNAPEPDPPPPGGTTESFPIAGTYFGNGTALRTAGLTMNWFLTQRLALSADYAHPLSGRSGQVTVPFRQRQCPPDSQAGASSCTESDMGPVLLDGQGSARSYSSDHFRVSLSYNFGHRDLYSCTGCSE